jgi:glycosyltransferase involved in cell wall biosynthesis
MKKQVIIITSYYPPIISVASNRIHSFAKYLDKNEFEVNVIFPFNGKVENNDHAVNVFPINNSSLFKYCSFDKNTNFFLHKSKALWNRFLMLLNVPHTGNFEKQAYKKAKEIIKPEADTIIISTSPYIETHFIAKKLKENFSKIRWIADLRDALSNNPYIPTNQLNMHHHIEDIILSYADAVSTVSLPIVKDLETKNDRKIPITEIRNGFDFEARLRFQFNERFTLVYAGTFYANRTPETFFEALKLVLKEHQLSDLRLVFLGNTSGVKIPDELFAFVERYDKVPYNDAINIIQNADGLLLIHPPTAYRGVYTGKLFDYLGAMRPIIAVVDKTDVAAELIKDCNAGFVADFNDIDEIKTAITETYKLWLNKQTLAYNQELILMHHRAYQVKILEHLIRQLYNE